MFYKLESPLCNIIREWTLNCTFQYVYVGYVIFPHHSNDSMKIALVKHIQLAFNSYNVIPWGFSTNIAQRYSRNEQFQFDVTVEGARSPYDV